MVGRHEGVACVAPRADGAGARSPPRRGEQEMGGAKASGRIRTGGGGARASVWLARRRPRGILFASYPHGTPRRPLTMIHSKVSPGLHAVSEGGGGGGGCVRWWGTVVRPRYVHYSPPPLGPALSLKRARGWDGLRSARQTVDRPILLYTGESATSKAHVGAPLIGH